MGGARGASVRGAQPRVRKLMSPPLDTPSYLRQYTEYVTRSWLHR